ncbi:MAG: transglutaminase domain-containing protein [Armatimonadetes bacterium]|nr:transglutaminase domain-containing protein [Armatimonadota bacterium]MDW8122970.1 transglutaminase domain-containing protein [Armatimonadota bacterium]
MNRWQNYMIIMGLGLSVLFGSLGTRAANETKERKLSLSLVYTTIVDAESEQKPVELWIPLPSDGAWQKVTNVVVDSPVGYQITQENEYGNRMVYIRNEGSSRLSPVRVSLQVERKEVRVLGQSNGAKRRIGCTPDCDCQGSECGTACTCAGCQHAARLKERSLQPDLLIPVGGRFLQIAEHIAGNKASVLDKIRAFYEHTVATVEYDYKRESPKLGQGDVPFVCDYRKGNCSDFHSYLISLCRSVGIPAYLEYGFPIVGIPAPESLPKEGKIPGYHCWTWVYDETVGWFPLDASDARRWADLGKKEMKDFLFGNLLLERSAVAFSRGRDITLQPSQKGSVLNYFIYPYAESDGKPVKVQWELTFRLINKS